MSCWSAENATKAYIRALKMGKRGEEPDVGEFISAIAAGNNAQLLVMACAGVGGPTTLALVAAAGQTGGRVVCILSSPDYYHASKVSLGTHANSVHFIIGDAKTLLKEDYKGADFVLVDCNIKDHRRVFRVAEEGLTQGGGLVVGLNALHKGIWKSEFGRTHFLPIGGGMLLTRVDKRCQGISSGNGCKKRSHWVVTVDKWTGEEHVFRVTSSTPKEIEFAFSKQT